MDILEIIFPTTCLGCGKKGKYLCTKCISGSKLSRQICPVCKKYSMGGFAHISCRNENSLNRLISIWEYERVIRKAILALKYKFVYRIAEELADSSTGEIKEKCNLKDACLIPIPLHWHRQNWRGFNQSEEVGKLIVKGMNWYFVPNLLIRKSSNPPQAELGRHERLKNVKNAFSLNPKYSKFLNQKQIILFDDVWTTGSTMNEAARVLKKNKAKEVWGITIAR